MRRSLFLLLFLLPIFILNIKAIELKNIRYFVDSDYARFVLDLTKPVKITEKELPGKYSYRLYFDIKHCSLSNTYPKDKRKEIKFSFGNLKRIRIGQRGKSTLRVVFDFTEKTRYKLFYLKSPFRIVLDFFKRKDGIVHNRKNNDKSINIKNLKTPKSAEMINGKYTMARQLGLGVKRLIIDPGHGGRDPGTMNRKFKLYEKNIVLDIAKKVKKIFQRKSRIEVLLTRNKDKYLTLEERTAIANSKKGDLFISLHINSAPRRKARGIETYYLSMTTDPNAIRLAAQENATANNSITELDSIIEKIIKDEKKKESKIFAGIVQKTIIKTAREKYSKVKNLGVKKAPFYVLIGADMPAILVEISFITNNIEVQRLLRDSYKKTIAKGIYSGIIKYINTLEKNETFLKKLPSKKK